MVKRCPDVLTVPSRSSAPPSLPVIHLWTISEKLVLCTTLASVSDFIHESASWIKGQLGPGQKAVFSMDVSLIGNCQWALRKSILENARLCTSLCWGPLLSAQGRSPSWWTCWVARSPHRDTPRAIAWPIDPLSSHLMELVTHAVWYWNGTGRGGTLTGVASPVLVTCSPTFVLPSCSLKGLSCSFRTGSSPRW